MDPQEIDDQLMNNTVKGLVFFTGLDLTENAQHNAIFHAFNESRERAVQIQYKMLTAESELFRTVVHRNEKSDESPALFHNSFRGIIKRLWPHKYLEERPALIVLFIDLDWDSPAWFEKRTECESKINSLRQGIGQREIRLAVVLIQREKTSLDDPMAAEKAMEICQHCRIASRFLYVLPLLADTRATFECVARLEIAFHEIAQEAYQACFKRIRSRNVPNNDQYLLLRQQFKLAFISELREDRHSALRYYRQACQICAELQTPATDAYEVLTIATLLNYKVCELNFLMSSPVEALNQFRKHIAHFFFRESGVYPSKELAEIELCLWKSQQCRLFAELFSRAVTSGLAAYASQNPGRFLDESASHYKQANALIRQLRYRLSQTDQQLNRRTPPLMSNDPLQSFDLNAPSLYFGQRPWRAKPSSSVRASSEPSHSLGLASSVAANQQLVTERAAKLFLERNIRENYTHSLQLYMLAITQFKRYHCANFVTTAYLEMADEYIASRQFAKAHQILQHVSSELRSTLFHPFLRDVLIKATNAAYCVCNLNEWISSLTQLLHTELWEKNQPLVEEIHEESWINEAQKFFAGESRTPFPIPQKNSIFPKEEIDSARQKWHQMASYQTSQHFKMDLSGFHQNSFLTCQMSFLVPAIDSGIGPKWSPPTEIVHKSVMSSPIVHFGELVPVQVILRNHSRIPFNFHRTSLSLEQFSTLTSKTIIEMQDWFCAGAEQKNARILVPPNRGETCLYFMLKPSFNGGDVQPMMRRPQSRAQSPSSSANELNIRIHSFEIGSSNGVFRWEIDAEKGSNMVDANHGCLSIKVHPQLKKIHLYGPTEKIQLFTDCAIDCAFTLANDFAGCEDLKNVRVLCQKVYREEEAVVSSSSTQLVQHTFSAPFHASPPSIQSSPNSIHGHTLVPVFNQEVATFLGQGESTDLSVRLQSKSNNCVGVQVQVCSLLSANCEPVEWIENFPVICMEPYKVETAIYSENDDPVQCLVNGQRYKILIDIQPAAKNINIFNVEWKLNTKCLEVCSQPPLSAILTAQIEKWTLGTKDPINSCGHHEIWILVQRNSSEEENLALGDVFIEWNSTHSCERIRSLLNLGQLPLISSPIKIQVDLFTVDSQAGGGQDDDFFEVGRPFGLKFQIWNTSNKFQPLAIHLEFEQTEGFIFAGVKEDYVTLFHDGEPYIFTQNIIPLCPGLLPFPKPHIQCANAVPGHQPTNLSNDELERLNRQIVNHAYNSLPKTIFVMVN